MFNIMVVEDDTDLRKMMESVLRHNGYRPLLAEDGEEALAILESEQADLIISDVMMPNMDGFELTELLRQSNYNMPILLVTVKDSYADKQRGFLAGVDDYMVKPIDINEMILRVRALLRRAQIANEHRLQVVDPAARGQGLARLFISFYEEEARRRGCPNLRIDTNLTNIPARTLYKSLGFREAAVITSEFNGIAGTSLVLLEKRLH